MSVQHKEGTPLEEMRVALRDQVAKGDAGVTGRKTVVDAYGGWGSSGGGAFSGKDGSKVDRSASYAARWIAKSLVCAGLARRVSVQVSYAIGVPRPLSLYVDSYGTSAKTDKELERIVESNFDLRPGIIVHSREELDTEGSTPRGEVGEDYHTVASHSERDDNLRDTEGSIPHGEEGEGYHTGALHSERDGNPRDTEGSIPRGEVGEDYHTVASHSERDDNLRDTEGSIPHGEEGEGYHTGALHSERDGNPRDTEGSIPHGEEGEGYHTGALHSERDGNPRDTEGSIPRGEEGEDYRTVASGKERRCNQREWGTEDSTPREEEGGAYRTTA
eukprot:Em0003g1582a